MTLQSMTMKSELLTLTGVSKLEPFDHNFVQRTANEPDFWMGNQILLRDVEWSATQLEAVFRRHFPNAAHRSFVWDMPDLDPAHLPDLSDLGADISGFDALSLQSEIREAPIPEGHRIRPLKTADDWKQSVALMAEVGEEEGYDPEWHLPFLEKRNTNRRRLINQGIGQWFGAVDGDQLVGQMGMFHDAKVARYQSVETRGSHRRRGICSALLRHAALWALGRAPSATVIIVAEADSAAGRLYRSMGFEHAERIYGALRCGY